MLLEALTAEMPVDWLGVTDPTAGRLDDFQLATTGRLDAYQIKWSESGGQIAWGALRGHLVDLVRDRRKLAALHTDRTVVGHLTTDRVPSTSVISGSPAKDGPYTGAAAVTQLLRPASEGRFATVDVIPSRWRWLWDDVADDIGVDAAGLLEDFAGVRFEFGVVLPKQRAVPWRDASRYREDIDEIRTTLFDVARDPARPVRLTRNAFIGRLPSGWRDRLELAAPHEFPVPLAYEPISDTTTAVEHAIAACVTGYVALVGSPGSGKSTLLSQELRARPDLVARYYAYVRGRAELGAQRAEAANFLHDLVLTLERTGLPRGPGPVDFDIANLAHRFQERLEQLGARYAAQGQRAIIMIDGLDHVERATPTTSLLQFLPAPVDVPEGVLFVVGSQSLGMLDEQIRTQLREAGRTVEMRGFDGPAIQRLAVAAGVAVGVHELQQVTGGHPLVLGYVLDELSALPLEQQPHTLSGMAPYGGDVLRLYDRLWTGNIRDDHELVELLALLSRVRSAIDLGWLRDRGSSVAAVRKLQARLTHLFRRDGERWYFFHDSFRVYLQRRTATIGDDVEPSEQEDRRHHRTLAAMCQASEAQDPMRWERLFHLAAADDHESVLALAVPDFFRDQLLSLRPQSLVAADISLAARSLGAVHDPMALVRLAFAAGELAQRSRNEPDREEFLDLLVDTGRWRTAVELLEYERDEYGEDDARTLPLRVAARLWHEGHREDARRLFIGNEPLDVLHGRTAEPVRDAFNLLTAWASAAVLIRGHEAVLTAAASLDLSELDQLAQSRHTDDTPVFRAWMLALASREAELGGLHERSRAVRVPLDPSADTDRPAWVYCRLDGRDRALLNEVVETVDPVSLHPDQRVWVAERLIADGRGDAAGRWIDGLKQPPVRETSSTDPWDDEDDRVRFNRVLAVLGKRTTGTDTVGAPDSSRGWATVDLARIAVDVGQMYGAAWAAQGLDPGAFTAEVRRLVGILDRRRDRLEDYTLRRSRPGLLATVVDVAAAHGEEHLRAYWALVQERWAEQPRCLQIEGAEVLSALARHATADELGLTLSKLIDVTRENSERHELARNLVGIARTALALGETQTADDVIQEAVAATLAIYPDKDYQLTSWIELLRPRLDRSDGVSLADWLAGVLLDVRDDAGTRQARSAAERLIAGEARVRPEAAWRLSGWLEDNGVLERDDRMLCLLEGTSDRADCSLWWVTLAEGVLPICAGDPPSWLGRALARACKTHSPEWAASRVRELAARIDVEVPPGQREGWRWRLADAAVAAGIDVVSAGLPAKAHPDRRPPRSRSRGTSEEQRDAYLAAHATPESLMAALESGDRDRLNRPWDEAFERLAPRLGEQWFERLFARRGHMDVHDRIVLIGIARRLGNLSVARELIDEALELTEASGWRRYYDGGTLLQLMTLLWEIDPQEGRRRAYVRMAADASTNRYLLAGLAEDLASFRAVFGVNDDETVADAVETYVRLLVGAPERLPPREMHQDDDGDFHHALACSLLDLLASPYRLGVVSGMQAVLAALAKSEPAMWKLVRARLDSGADTELCLRIFAVLEAHVRGGSALPTDVLDVLEPWTTARELALRRAARRLLVHHDRCPRPVPTCDLPAALTLIVPRDPAPETPVPAVPLGPDSLDSTLLALNQRLDPLADQAGVDRAALEEHVGAIARRLAADARVDDAALRTDHGVLGWTYHQPSFTCWDHAAQQAASELVDSGRVASDDALLMTSGPMYDPALLAARPAPQPPSVQPALTVDQDRWVSPESWLDGVADAEARLVRRIGDWVVIGEMTDLRYLSREMPRERRWQSLGAMPRPKIFRRMWLDNVKRGAVPSTEGAVVAHNDVDFRGPSEWLALSPLHAEVCGWVPTNRALIGYRDEEGVVARSVWWRSGWPDSAQWTSYEQVGQGWLVLVADRKSVV